MITQRARVRLIRQGEGVTMSHLRQIDMVRRALTESGWPVSMTNEKRTKPRTSFGPAIAVGYESECEWVDVDLAARMDFKAAAPQLAPHLKPGYSVAEVKSVPRYFPSIEELTNVIFYEVTSSLLEGTQPKWEDFWKKKECIVIKKKKDKEEKIDMRQAVRSWALKGKTLSLQVRIGPNRTLKPERIVQEVCGLSPAAIKTEGEEKNFWVKRTRLCFEKENNDLIDL